MASACIPAGSPGRAAHRRDHDHAASFRAENLLAKMIDGSCDASTAFSVAVNGSQDLIIKYLSS